MSDEITRSIRGRCDGIRSRCEDLIRAVSEEDDRATVSGDLAQQVEHAAAVDAAGRRPFTFDERARAHLRAMPARDGGPDADEDLLG